MTNAAMCVIADIFGTRIIRSVIMKNVFVLLAFHHGEEKGGVLNPMMAKSMFDIPTTGIVATP